MGQPLSVQAFLRQCLSALQLGGCRAARERRLKAEHAIGIESLESRILLTSDFGDAPLPYPTTLAEDGARHTATGLTLGATRDSSESDGVHSVNADADGADEDGVMFLSLVTGNPWANVNVNVQGTAGKLDAWIDFNGDGNWGGPGEQIFAGQAVAVGDNWFTFAIPSTARSGATYARFRLSTTGGLGVGGAAVDGEVEDYRVTIQPPGSASGVFGTSTAITGDADGAASVFAADIDGDGDLDVLSASNNDDTIAWHENIAWYEGKGNHRFEKHTITTNADGVYSVFAADVDGDGDLDVLSASIFDDTIAWYENNGSQVFTRHDITTTAGAAFSVFAADVDGDGDLDVLSASLRDDTIAWYENDGSQNFTQRVITGVADGARSVFAADVDGDGDLDVLSASLSDDTIAWYENDGGQNFTQRVITDVADGAASVFAADVDGDGDLDVLSASLRDDTIAWYENDGSQNFTQRVITDVAYGAVSVFAADVDGDGDLDVLSASLSDDTIAWYENGGSQNFTRRNITTTADYAYSVFAADVDGDRDLDVLSASFLDGTIAWYENFSSDFGDAPAPYPTTAAEDGARHDPVGPTLGATRDLEFDGMHSPGANADYEDGVTFGTLVTGDLKATVTVNVQGPAGKLDAWIDFNGDGNWGGPGEQIFAGQAVAVGDNALTFAVPSSSLSGETYARFRLSTAGGLGVGGAAVDGEVEDYRVTIQPPASASGVFGTSTAITTSADGAFNVLAADVDSDGDLDILSASAIDDTIAWYENDGNQNFTRRTITTTADRALSVFAADVDGDGDLDVLSASESDDTIAWYENDGSQNFTRRNITTTADGAYSVFAADVDGDGDLDVLSASRFANTIAWYENDGSQNFTERIITATASNARSVFAADVDGDGDLDVLSASFSDDTIAWYENDGSQNFAPRNITTSAFGARSVFAADVDGDGDVDVLSASLSDDTIAWYENDGSQNFTKRVIITTADVALSVFAADVDGDGDLDVLGASRDDSTIAWYENDGNQNFAPRNITTSAFGARSVFAADVDGDGDLDVLSASFNDDKIAWYENFSSDFGDAPAPYPTTTAEDGARHDPVGPTLGATRDLELDGTHSPGADADHEDGVTFGTLVTGNLTATVTVNVQGAAGKLDAWIDFNGDGNWGGPGEQIFAGQAVAVGDNALTFAVPSNSLSGETYARFRLSTAGGLGVGGTAVDGEVEDYRVTIQPPASASGVFGTSTAITTSADGARSVFAADIDGDGDLDVLSASFFDDTIAWYENDGSQNFTRRNITTTADAASSVFAADVDGDGDLDVLSASLFDNTIAWHENDGSQNFTRRNITTTAYEAYSVFAADVDGDGDLDVLSASFFDNTIAWYENDGSQNFTRRNITTTADGAFSVFAADVDGDGDLDVLSASADDNTIAWYENDGSHNFTQRVITDVAVGALSVFAADIDGDGDLDVLSASLFDDTIAWYENDGSQNFTRRNITTTADGALSVFAADVDGDGDLDVLSASTDDSTIAWYENDGSQNFTQRVITDVAVGARSVFAADVDGDGDLDVLSSSFNDDTIAWYEQQGLLTVEFSTASIAENEGSLQGTVTRGTTDLDQPLTVSLSSNDTTEATVPSQVTIPAHETSVSFTLTVVDDPLADGTRTVTVSATADGYLADDTTVDITDHETPLEIISPTGITDDMTPQVTWNAVGGADRYEIWVRNLTTKERVADQRDIKTTSFTPGTPWDGTSYRVWVRAFSASGEEGPWSTADFRFRIRNAPQITAPTLYRTIDATPTLAWDPIPDTQWGTPESFEVWIKRHQTKHDHVLNIPGPGYTTESLPMGRYNFWVRGILPGGLESGWSRAHEVIIVTPPTLTDPIGTVTGLTPTITWNALPGASTYELYLADVTANQSPLLQPTGIQTTSWTVSQPLTSGHSYKVWARAYDEKGWRGYYGDAIEFNVADSTEANPRPHDAGWLAHEPLLLASLDPVKIGSDLDSTAHPTWPLSDPGRHTREQPTATGSTSPAHTPETIPNPDHELNPNDQPAAWPQPNVHTVAVIHQASRRADVFPGKTVFAGKTAQSASTDSTMIDRVLNEWARSGLAFR